MSANTIEKFLIRSPSRGSIALFSITQEPRSRYVQGPGKSRRNHEHPSYPSSQRKYETQKKAVCGRARTGIRERNRSKGRLESWRGLTLLLLQRQLALVVTVELASEQKREFRVVLLLLHRHLLKLGPVASHELSELVDDISKLLVWRTEKRPRGASAKTAQTRGPWRSCPGPLGRGP